MKCPDCGKKIIITGKEKENIEICPYCKKKIYPKYADFDMLSEGIIYAMTAAGDRKTEIIKDKSKFFSYLSATG